MIKPKIFLTGSTSYVGTKFIELYGPQFEIFGVARSDKNAPIDLLDFKRVKEVFEDFKPDYVLHLAADVGRDLTTSTKITKTNPAITKNLVDLSLDKKLPFIFTSTEAVYGGKERSGGYSEIDAYKPRNPYGVSKVASEKIVMDSGLPYLITRGHRHVGISRNFHKSKQFLDALYRLMDGKEVHLDSKKLFTPVLINNVCDILVRYISKDSDKKVLINIGVDDSVTFYDLMLDIAKSLNINTNLIKPDGDESGWPHNSTLSVSKLHELDYPSITYDEMLAVIKTDVLNL